MYEVTANQKERLLLDLLKAIETCNATGQKAIYQQLMSAYGKLQSLRQGVSLTIGEAVKLKKTLSSVKKLKKKRR